MTSCPVWLKSLAEPRGTGNFRDGAVLLLWEGYAAAKGRRVSAEWDARSCTPAGPLRYRREFFRDYLLDHILAFWEAHSIDREHGGFITHLDREGRVYDEPVKNSAMQARMIFAFAKGYELQKDIRYKRIARDGVDFLIDHIWDRDFGGWFQTVARDGTLLNGRKRLFDQAYVTLGLSEYYRITRDDVVLPYLTKAYEIFEARAWDRIDSGYYELCERDWRIVSDKKVICVQLDFLKAFRSLFAATAAERYLMKAETLARLMMTRMRDGRHGCLVETCHRNWTYHPLATRDQILLGHNLKCAWLLLELYKIMADRQYYICARDLIDFCIRHGWDREYGGFFHYAYRNGILASEEKLWWPEADGLCALLLMYELSGESVYLDHVTALLDFCLAHFADHEHGEWYTSCNRDGSVRNANKGAHWKAAYHTVLAFSYLAENFPAASRMPVGAQEAI